ncbi:hypothetical protein [Arthrobacter crystallopoietes]|uniref:Uncharacterized protein n=1 Tax=Crystallibacter crystallopoietes TaxID=37928 RepID=A0A1H1CVK7_9MICC|nr:hypothetical protein [Arthrobacter crystallopoietes]AUI50584.1 hypothetical protein AC20117_06820 [Arthrobacter crystallopoietes]SDQ68291.1 hypothetical protein SAMN04489742_2117 [Arthrobacter crystallopoietes]
MECDTADSRFRRFVDAAGLEPGDEIEAYGRSGLLLRGRVDEIALHLEVIWIRESGTNDRRLLHVDDGDISRIGP